MDNINIYICAHSTIKNKKPTSLGYVVAAQNGDVVDDQLPVINMEDDFSKTHNICYGECCQIRYALEHPELLPDYVGFCHYRRFWREFYNNPQKAVDIIKKHGAIFMTTWTCGLSNKINITLYHSNYYLDPLINAIHKVDSSYDEACQEFLEDTDCSYCNMFIMSKKDFLETARFVFDVLKEFDKTLGVDGNKSVRDYIVEEHKKNHWFKGDVNWQSRLEGFMSEYIWDIVKRKKFPNAYLSKVDIVADRDFNIKNQE